MISKIKKKIKNFIGENDNLTKLKRKVCIIYIYIGVKFSIV